MSVYRVTGRHRYREHNPGELFEATLEPDVEERAVKTGAIEVLERSMPTIRPGTWRLPPGWTTQAEDNESPGRGSHSERS